MSEQKSWELVKLALSHSLTLDMLNNFCFHVYALTFSHSFNLSFTHSRHAEQLLFSSLCSKLAVYRRKLQCFFFDLSITRSIDIRVHRVGSQLTKKFHDENPLYTVIVLKMKSKYSTVFSNCEMGIFYPQSIFW